MENGKRKKEKGKYWGEGGMEGYVMIFTNSTLTLSSLCNPRPQSLLLSFAPMRCVIIIILEKKKKV